MKILFAINMFCTGIVIVLCLILLVISYAHADENLEDVADTIQTSGNIVKIMVLDTGIDGGNPLLRHYMPEVRPHSKLSGQNKPDYIDDHGHGSHVTGVILFGGFHPGKNGKWYVNKNDIMCDNIQVYSCKYYNAKSNDLENLDRTVKCLQRAYKYRMNVINYSGGGIKFSQDEYDMIRKLGKNHHTLMTAALGNEGMDVEVQPYYPACYSMENKFHHTEALDNIIGIGYLDSNGERAPLSNYGSGYPMALGKGIVSTGPHGQFEIMSGSSQASAMYLHKLLIEKCKEFKH